MTGKSLNYYSPIFERYLSNSMNFHIKNYCRRWWYKMLHKSDIVQNLDIPT
jgi:hypothetical protein